jgi:hypothetical protein
MVPEGTSDTTMKNRIRRIARDLNVPVPVRRVPGGMIFWRSNDKDIQQAQETASRLQTARQPQPQARPRGRRPKGTRSACIHPHACHQRPSGGTGLDDLRAESVLLSPLHLLGF